MEVSSDLKNAYSDQYSGTEVEWRRMGAKYKALNILELAGNLNAQNVCEVGCGEGSILQWLAEFQFAPQLYGIDISKSGIERTAEKRINNLVELKLFDGYTIPYPDKFFDLAICSHVIEHVEHPRILLREIQRISKKQVFEVPIDFSFFVDKKSAHYLAYGHINIYTPALFRFLLKSENFKILRDIPYFYPAEIAKFQFKDRILKRFIQGLKQFILKSIPYLRGIKPSSYAVLTEQNTSPVQIMQH